MFSINTPYGQMLREAISSFPKATKLTNLMINVVAPFYAPSDLDYEQTNEQLQMFINKAQDILLRRHSSNTIAIDSLDSLPIYDMFPKHGGIFMHKSLKQCLYELSTDRITLSPERTQPSGNLNRSSFFTSDESSEDETELIFEIPEQGTSLNIPLGILSPLLNDTALADIQKQRK